MAPLYSSYQAALSRAQLLAFPMPPLAFRSVSAAPVSRNPPPVRRRHGLVAPCIAEIALRVATRLSARAALPFPGRHASYGCA
jgi:hypothetical protein